MSTPNVSWHVKYEKAVPELIENYREKNKTDNYNEEIDSVTLSHLDYHE